MAGIFLLKRSDTRDEELAPFHFIRDSFPTPNFKIGLPSPTLPTSFISPLSSIRDVETNANEEEGRLHQQDGNPSNQPAVWELLTH